MASKRFGFHSGIMKCQDAKVQGDLYVQDDIVFSDVSAGQLGVTGGIVMDSTVSAVGISMAGTYSTSAISISGNNLGRALLVGSFSSNIPINATKNYPVGVFTDVTSAITSGGAVMEGVWSRLAVSASVSSGSLYGMRSQLKVTDAATLGGGGQFAGLWAYFETQESTAITLDGWCQALQARIDLLDQVTTVYDVAAIVAETGSNASATIGTDYCGLIVRDAVYAGGSKDFTVGIKIDNDCATTGIEVEACTTGVLLSEAMTTGLSVTGATTTAISLAGDAVTGISITSGMSATNMISLAGTASGSGIAISGACGTGVYITGNCTTGLYLNTGSFTTGVSLAGTLGTGIAISACTTAIDINGSATTGISISGAMANPIVITPATAATCAIAIGTSISDGMTMTGTKNGMIRAFGQVKVTEALSNDIRGIWGRVRQDADVDVTGGYQICGIQGSAKLYGGSAGTTTTLWSHSGLYGSFETDAVSTSNVASTGYVSGVIGLLGMGAGFTIDSGAVAAALRAKSNCNASMTATGSFAGLYMDVEAGCKAFTTGIQIPDSVATTGISIGVCTTGLNVVGATNIGVNVTMAALAAGDAYSGIRSTVTSAAASNAYGAAGYFDTTITGTVGSGAFVYGLGSWINGSATLDATGKYIVAQDNGLYIDTSATLTGAKMVFGLRMESFIGAVGSGITHGELVFPFSLNTANNGITALFECMTASDLGTVTNIGADAGTLVPLFRDAGGNMRYVKLYTAV